VFFCSTLSKELNLIQSNWNDNKNDLLEKIASEKLKIQFSEEEVAYRLKQLEDRKIELIKTDNEVKMQIKLLEAKSSPNTVWLEAFTQGFSKAWDSINPIMMDNVLKSKKFIEENAIMETIKRNSNGNHKTTN